MSGRFSAPVYPGDELTVSIWTTGRGAALFQTRTGDGTVVIDHGRAAYR
jgi:acyl dehydratase